MSYRTPFWGKVFDISMFVGFIILNGVMFCSGVLLMNWLLN